jgi:hypothetical protein
LTAEPLDRKRRPGPRSEHDVNHRRRLSAKRFGQASRARTVTDLVYIVENEHEIVSKLSSK